MIPKDEFKKYATKHLRLREELLDHHIGETENMTRTVIEERPKPFREIDVFSRLIMNRIIFLGTAIDDNVANVVTAQLLFLESVGPEKPITLYFNFNGHGPLDGWLWQPEHHRNDRGRVLCHPVCKLRTL